MTGSGSSSSSSSSRIDGPSVSQVRCAPGRAPPPRWWGWMFPLPSLSLYHPHLLPVDDDDDDGMDGLGVVMDITESALYLDC